MTGSAGPEIAAVIAEYEFSDFRTIVDVGGGHGNFLATILRAYPDTEGILADLPMVVEAAERQLQSLDVAHRCKAIPIDFFQSVPAGGDAYILKRVIHDWDDDRSSTILRNCRRAMNGSGKLLIIEMIVPSGNEPDFSKWLDIAMLVYGTGRERTAAEYENLLAASGFRLERIVRTRSAASVIEAAPV